MLNKNAKKWVEALRSGKYKQTRSVLRDRVGFCCLGVACDLYAQEHPRAKWEDGYFMDKADTLPKTVQKWLGLRVEDGSTDAESLVDFNDGNKDLDVRPHTFNEIADIIESKPAGLFGKVTPHAG